MSLLKIPNLLNYNISEEGAIYSTNNFNKIVKIHTHDSGYIYIKAIPNNVKSRRYYSYLVAALMLYTHNIIPLDDTYIPIHIDDNFNNFNVLNLTWKSTEEANIFSACDICGKGTKWLITIGTFAKFCSKQCDSEYHRQKLKGNKLRKGLKQINSFEKGHIPWNKNLKGIHLSPDSEFKPGHFPANTLPIGSVRIWTDSNGKQRKVIKTNNPNIWKFNYVKIWEDTYGSIPNGYIIHHKDRNTLNDTVDNLEIMTRAEHINEHRDELYL